MFYRNVVKFVFFLFFVFAKISLMGQMPNNIRTRISPPSSRFDYATSVSSSLGMRGGARNPLNFYRNERSQSDRKQDRLQSQVITWGGRAQAAGASMVQRQTAEVYFRLANIALDFEREAHRSCQEVITAHCRNRDARSQGRNIVVGQGELNFLEERYSKIFNR